jgi:hypothetical protein
MCFGEIEHELSYGERIPPESEEERRAKIVYEIKLKEREEAISKEKDLFSTELQKKLLI